MRIHVLSSFFASLQLIRFMKWDFPGIEGT